MNQHDPLTPPGDHAEHAQVLRHEERLHVGVERAAVERVRIRRVIVTEQRTITVDVRHEEIHVTREPVTDATSAEPSSRDSDMPIVVLRHEEQVRISTVVVPVERVSVDVTTTTEQRRIAATVAREIVTVVDPTSPPAA